MDVEDEPPDDLKYSGEGKNNLCITREHVEDIFEAINRNTSKFRSKIRNAIAQLTTMAKPIDLIRTAHPQF